MFTRTLALLIQAFRVDARQLRAHLGRGLAAATVLAILVGTHLQLGRVAAPGLRFCQGDEAAG